MVWKSSESKQTVSRQSRPGSWISEMGGMAQFWAEILDRIVLAIKNKDFLKDGIIGGKRSSNDVTWFANCFDKDFDI